MCTSLTLTNCADTATSPSKAANNGLVMHEHVIGFSYSRGVGWLRHTAGSLFGWKQVVCDTLVTGTCSLGPQKKRKKRESSFNIKGALKLK